jgi:RHS repeat-associated protein
MGIHLGVSRATHTDFAGRVTTYTYDDHDRVSQIAYPDAVESFTYTVGGQRETATDARGVTAWAYDTRGRLLSETQPDGTVLSYTYDAAGNRTSVTAPSGTTSYTFDALNRMASVIAPDGGVTTYTYNAIGRQDVTTLPNATQAEYEYDSLGRLTYLENRKGDGSVITSYEYTLDANGNRTRVDEADGRVVDYSYDPLNRLTSETVTAPATDPVATTYVMDDVGNRLSKETCSGSPAACSTISYAYNANDQLVGDTGPDGLATYSYDPNGNLTRWARGADETTYSWDTRNRMVGATTPEHVLGFAYNVDGIRVGKTVDGAATRFVVDGNQQYAQVIEERDGAGSLVAGYVYGADLISQARGGAESYYATDGLGSTRALTDASGDMTDSYAFDAYGGLAASAGTTANSYLFTGEQRDAETGNYYLRARYYSPEAGGFVSKDDWRGNSQQPLSLNRYLYAAANPVTNGDPNGKQFTSIGAAMAVVNVLDISVNISPVPAFGPSVNNLAAMKYLPLVISAFKDVKGDIEMINDDIDNKPANIRSAVWESICKYSTENTRWMLWRNASALESLGISVLLWQPYYQERKQHLGKTPSSEFPGTSVAFNSNGLHFNADVLDIYKYDVSRLKDVVVHEIAHGPFIDLLAGGGQEWLPAYEQHEIPPRMLNCWDLNADNCWYEGAK